MSVFSLNLLDTPAASGQGDSLFSVLGNPVTGLCLLGVVLMALGLGLRKNTWVTVTPKQRVSLWLPGILLIGVSIGLWLWKPIADHARETAQSGPTIPPGTTVAKEFTEPPPPVRPPSRSGYSFEDGIMGWMPEERGDTRAVQSVDRWSGDPRAYDGTYVLRLDVDLAGGDSLRSKGEAWVELGSPRDLTGHQLVARVYAPPDARGEQSDPNGLQVFVKDTAHRALYGPWTRVSPGDWMPVGLKVVTDSFPGRWMSDGFDPSAVIAVGVKIAAGGHSVAQYRGPIYIDRVEW